MAFLAALPGILSSIVGGPANILKSIGATVNGIITGVQKGESFGNVIGGALSKGISQLTGADEGEKREIAEAQQTQKEEPQHTPFFTNTRSATRNLVSPLVTSSNNASLGRIRLKRERIPIAYRAKLYPIKKAGLSANAVKLLMANGEMSRKELEDTTYEIGNEYDEEHQMRKKKGRKRAHRVINRP